MNRDAAILSFLLLAKSAAVLALFLLIRNAIQ